MRFNSYIFIALVAAVAAGCSGSGSDMLPQPRPVAADSVTEPAEPPMQVLDHRLDSLGDALAYMASADSAAAYSQGVMAEIARQHLPYADSLLHSRSPYFVIADKQEMYVVVYDRFGRQQAAYRMACSAKYGAKHARRDNRTPEGYFRAEGIYNSSEWLYTDDDGHTSQRRGQFGPRYIRLQTPVTRQVGIHGTCAPWSLGRRSSHGCMRLHNAHIMEMMRYATKGMPVIVSPSDRDQQVNRDEGYTVAQLRLGPFTDNPRNEDVAGYREYTNREESIQRRTDSLASLRRQRLERQRIADSIAAAAESPELQAAEVPADDSVSVETD